MLENKKVIISDSRCDKIDDVEGKKAIDRDKLEDIERVVKDDWNCGYAECSAKTGEGIVGAFKVNIFIHINLWFETLICKYKLSIFFKELLLQAKVSYNLSPAVRRRRQSLPAYMTERRDSVAQGGPKHKRHSCTVA